MIFNLGGTDDNKYLPLTGGTLDGSLIVKSDGADERALSVRNSARKINLEVKSSGEFYLWDGTNVKSLMISSADGNTNTFNGTATGNLPLTGGTLTDSLFVKRTDNNSVMLGVENALNKLHFGVNGSGVAYMQDKNGNVIVCNTDGTRTFNGTASGNLQLNGGGKVTGSSSDTPIMINGTNTSTKSAYVQFMYASGNLGHLGFDMSGKPTVKNSSGTASEILHTGNSTKVVISSTAPSDTSALWVY